MSIEALAPLVGSWLGQVRIDFPGSDRIELTHSEQVRWVGQRSMLTIEGNSYHGGCPTGRSDTPAFTALAVIYAGDDLARDDQLYWHAFRDGHALQTVADVAAGRYRWIAPSPAGAIQYTAEFDPDSWREWGILALDDGDEQVFTMELQRHD